MLNLIFQKRFTTIVSIPPPCRLHFSRTLKSALDKVLYNYLDLSTWLQLLLLPICTLNLYMPMCSREERAGTRKRLQIESINQALFQWKESNGCVHIVEKLLAASKKSQQVSKPNKMRKHNSNVQACKKKLSHGHYTAAVRVLSSGGVTPNTAETLHELRQKHPSAPPPIIPSENVGVAVLSVDSKTVLDAIKSFPKGTSCGRDGLRAQHLLDDLSGAAAAVGDDLLAYITGVVNIWLAGKCSSVLGEYIASPPLTPLLEPGGGLRPIAVGAIWRRLCSKIVAKSVGKDIALYLGDHQFGVGVPCGAEGIIHAANRLLEMKGTNNTMFMLLIDFSNAFNMVDRTTLIHEVRIRCPSISRWVEFCYTTPARLYYNESVLSSALGVQQGDPLGPLLYWFYILL